MKARYQLLLMALFIAMVITWGMTALLAITSTNTYISPEWKLGYACLSLITTLWTGVVIGKYT